MSRDGRHIDAPGLAASEVTLTADPDAPYEELVNAMDALRHDGRRPLFTDVAISAGVR